MTMVKNNPKFLKRALSVAVTFCMIISLIFVNVTVANAADYLKEGYFSYAISASTGNALLYGCDTSVSGFVQVPQTLGGRSVSRIKGNAFKGCTLIEGISIPKNVTAIEFQDQYGANAFAFCTSLKTITTEDGHTAFKAIDNVLFNKGITELLLYPIARGASSYEMPDTVTTVGYRAFANCADLTNIKISKNVTTIKQGAFQACTGLKSIKIPSGVETVPQSAFHMCTNLESVIIPASVTSIDAYAFADCDKITEIHFLGTKDQWDAITIAENNGYLNNNPNVMFESPLTFKIKNESDSQLLSTTVEYGETVNASIIPKQPNTSYELYYDKNFTTPFDINTPIVKDTTVYIKYTEIKYTYIFKNYDGSVFKKDTITVSALIPDPGTSTKPSSIQSVYTFNKWIYNDNDVEKQYNTSMQISKDVEFTPVFTESTRKYTYKFKNYDNSTIKEETIDYNTEIVAPTTNPTRPTDDQYSYTFSNWAGFTPGMLISQDITFDAVYSKTTKKYTYKFVLFDGTVLSQKTVDYGTVITAPESVPAKDAYNVFDYWDGYTSNMQITEDIVFNAVYKYAEPTDNDVFSFVHSGKVQVDGVLKTNINNVPGFENNTVTLLFIDKSDNSIKHIAQSPLDQNKKYSFEFLCNDIDYSNLDKYIVRLNVNGHNVTESVSTISVIADCVTFDIDLNIGKDTLDVTSVLTNIIARKNIDYVIYTAFYNEQNSLISLGKYENTSSGKATDTINLDNITIPKDADSCKVMVWMNNGKAIPLSQSKDVKLNN